jgi:hypothetical protein
LKASKATLGIVPARDVFPAVGVPVAVADLELAKPSQAHPRLSGRRGRCGWRVPEPQQGRRRYTHVDEAACLDALTRLNKLLGGEKRRRTVVNCCGQRTFSRSRRGCFDWWS